MGFPRGRGILPYLFDACLRAEYHQRALKKGLPLWWLQIPIAPGTPSQELLPAARNGDLWGPPGNTLSYRRVFKQLTGRVQFDYKCSMTSRLRTRAVYLRVSLPILTTADTFIFTTPLGPHGTQQLAKALPGGPQCSAALQRVHGQSLSVSMLPHLPRPS